MKTKKTLLIDSTYPKLMAQLVGLLERARVNSAGSVNAVMTATYWEIGRRMPNKNSAARSVRSTERLYYALDRGPYSSLWQGFSERNLRAMRESYRAWSIPQTPSAESSAIGSPAPFPLPWSHYVRLFSVTNSQARPFYENEALRGGWSVN